MQALITAVYYMSDIIQCNSLIINIYNYKHRMHRIIAIVKYIGIVSLYVNTIYIILIEQIDIFIMRNIDKSIVVILYEYENMTS